MILRRRWNIRVFRYYRLDLPDWGADMSVLRTNLSRRRGFTATFATFADVSQKNPPPR